MQKREKEGSIRVILASLGWPVLWGMAAWVAFYALVQQNAIVGQAVSRYVSSHPVEYVETAMFFVGLAALVIKGLNVVGQYATNRSVHLEEPPLGGNKVQDCTGLLSRLAEMPAKVQNAYLVRRLRDALHFVERKGSADGLDDELKYLADVDAGRLHDGYALVRIIIWATPMLGFLGTVIGITLALGDLSPQSLVDSPNEAMEGLLSGLSVAFDTTALALSLSVFLMFAQFVTDQVESHLLATVDARANAELVGRFEEYGSGNDPQLASMRRMGESVIKTSEDLVKRQVEIWQSTIDTANQRWSDLIDASGEKMQSALTTGLTESMKQHAEKLIGAEETANQRARIYLDELQATLATSSQAVQRQQSELIKQGQIMLQVLEATGEITSLEQSLNGNLNALAGSKNFEDTVMSLSAAIHLLNGRLAEMQGNSSRVDLGTTDSQDRAA